MRRFKPPWTAERIPGGYVVKDATGQSLAYVYARETRADADPANVLTMDDARRIASNIAKRQNCYASHERARLAAAPAGGSLRLESSDIAPHRGLRACLRVNHAGEHSGFTTTLDNGIPPYSGRHDADLGSGSVAKRCINVNKTGPSAEELSPHKRGKAQFSTVPRRLR